MGVLSRTSKVSALVSRLRNLEAECIRLGSSNVSTDHQTAKTLYEERLQQLENSHSQSWFGDHADTYFNDFKPIPPGQSFDVEWGFIPGFHGARNRGWRIYSRDEIRSFVFHDIGEDVFYETTKLAERLVKEFSNVRDQSLDTMEVLAKEIPSNANARYIERIEKLQPYKPVDFINSRIKSAPRMTRDSEEIAKGQTVPAHVQFQSSFSSISSNKSRFIELADILRQLLGGG